MASKKAIARAKAEAEAHMQDQLDQIDQKLDIVIGYLSDQIVAELEVTAETPAEAEAPTEAEAPAEKKTRAKKDSGEEK